MIVLNYAIYPMRVCFWILVCPLFFAAACSGLQSDDGTGAEYSDTDADGDSDADVDDDSPAPVCPIPVELKTTDVIAIVQSNEQSCYPKRLDWNPATQESDCHLVFAYAYDSKESAESSRCPRDDGQEWEDDDGRLNEMTRDLEGESRRFWVRRCTVKRLAAPLNCTDLAKDDDFEDDTFGWYYCENPGENNATACTDQVDNDEDGAIDFEDSDCDACTTDNGCSDACPYQVSITPSAREAGSKVDIAEIECLQQFRVETPACSESSSSTCTDGEDNDGNGAYDCSRPANRDADAAHTAYIADPNCCPMSVAAETNECVFLDESETPSETNDFAYLSYCDVSASPSDIPDACCQAASDLRCALPDAIRTVCEDRGI